MAELHHHQHLRHMIVAPHSPMDQIAFPSISCGSCTMRYSPSHNIKDSSVADKALLLDH